MKELQGQIKSSGGTPLSFRKWNGTGNVIIYLHGIESNSEWFSPFASRLNEKGFTLYGLDRRGSGLNQENRGDIDDYNVFFDDIKAALNFVKDRNIGRKIYIMGICWGGLL
ncbi:MAG: alpha/beta fold hydrolase, partial [Candidatus Omnitrophota bacterium]|nr:alpha/beta fold hydrolase [Candidatus Omnitrophota bacterium]